jgi:hypothetical protein
MSRRTNGYWRRHPVKEIQALLVEFHEHGWRIIDPPTYYKALCPCAQKHKTTVHLTPSDPNYVLNKQKWLRRQSCYQGDIIEEGG